MCAWWSCPGKAWKGVPAIAAISSKLGSKGVGWAGWGKIAFIFFTPIAWYIDLYAWYKSCIWGFDCANCNWVCAIEILCVWEKMLGSATGKISTLSSKSVTLTFLDAPGTS